MNHFALINPPKVAIIGHPLAASENRLPFLNLEGHMAYLGYPKTWKSPGANHKYFPFEEVELERIHFQKYSWDAIPLPIYLACNNSLHTWGLLNSFIQSSRPDLIYCWEEPWSLAIWQIRKLAQKYQIPFLFYSAENRPKRLPLPFRALMKRAFQASAGAIVPQPECATNLRVMGFTGPIYEVPLWLDLSNRSIESLIINQHAPISKQFTLAYVGRMIPLKRVPILIEALEFCPNWKLQLFGDGPELNKLKIQANSGKASNRILFHGNLFREELFDKLAQCDLLALPTGENGQQAEQFGRVIPESLALGLEAVVSNSGYLKTWANRFSQVHLLDPFTPQNLVSFLNGFETQRHNEMSRIKVATHIRREFGVDHAAELFSKVFHEQLKNKSIIRSGLHS